MNGLIEFEAHKIRFVGTQDEPEWVAADVCKVIGLSQVSKAMRGMGPSESGSTYITTAIGEQEVKTVKEPGLYRLVFKSRKPEAQAFLRFVTHKVLPSLRQHGCYPPPDISVNDHALVRTDDDRIAKILGDAIGEKMAMYLGPVASKVDEVAVDVRQINDRLEVVEFTLAGNRKNLTTEVRTLHVRVVHSMYRGMCPCCEQSKIVENNNRTGTPSHFDHWLRRNQNAKASTWLVCAECNGKLRDNDFHRSKQETFNHYQANRERYERVFSPTPMLPGM